MFVIAIIAYNNDDRKTANVLFVCLHCILRRTNSFSCQWHLFFQKLQEFGCRETCILCSICRHIFILFLLHESTPYQNSNRIPTKISTTAIIAIGVIGVVNNTPPTNNKCYQIHWQLCTYIWYVIFHFWLQLQFALLNAFIFNDMYVLVCPFNDV